MFYLIGGFKRATVNGGSVSFTWEITSLVFDTQRIVPIS